MWQVRGKREIHVGFWRENKGNRQLGRPMHRWDNNNKMDLKLVG